MNTGLRGIFDKTKLYIDKKLLKEEQQEVKEQFIKAGLKDRTMGINTLNSYFEEENFNYYILAKRTNSKRYWIIVKDIDK